MKTIATLGSGHFSKMAGFGGIKSLTTGRNQKDPTSLVRATTPRVDLDMEKEKGTEKWDGGFFLTHALEQVRGLCTEILVPRGFL